MSVNNRPGGTGASLPEDIASKAGLPRESGVDHSLHAVDERAAAAARAASAKAHDRAHDEAHDRAEQVAASGARAAESVSQAQDAAAGIGARVADTASAARERVGEKVDDLRDRASQTYDRASRAYDDARSWAGDRYETHSRQAADLADRGYRSYRAQRTATERFVSENPLLVGVVGLAAGLLLGSLLPRTRQEDRALGPWADEARDQGLRYARDLTHRGREYVEAVLDPDNLDAAVKRASAPDDENRPYDGPERTAHRL